MPRLLRIDSSSRREGSHSRQLADRVQGKWLRENPRGQVLVRDLACTPVPHISDATISAFFTPKQQHSMESRKAAALSDELIGELLAADALLISVPIYNFSIPSALKAYIDHVVRIDYTFAFDPQKGLHGLIRNKRAFVAAAYGAAGYFDGALAPLNFLEPYMKSLLGFLGITDVTFFSLEGSSTDAAALETSRARAAAEIERIVSSSAAPW